MAFVWCVCVVCGVWCVCGVCPLLPRFVSQRMCVDRTVSYTKKYSSSVIRVTLSDTLGFHTISQGYGTTARAY